MAEGKKKKKEKLKAKINTNTYDVEFIKDVDGGRIKKGSKAKLSASTAIDFHVQGYVKLSDKVIKDEFPETKKFMEANEEHVKALQAEGNYD